MNAESIQDPGRTEEKAERRRVILEAAIETFARQGFASARTREIAAAAGVAEGTIYLYFKSKEELLLTTFRERVTEFSRITRDLVGSPGSFPERLEAFVAAQLSAIEANPALAAVVLVESRQTTRFYGPQVRDVLREYASAVEALLQSGIDEGSVRPDINVALARRFLIGCLEEVELDWLVGQRTHPLAAIAPSIASQFIHGIATGH